MHTYKRPTFFKRTSTSTTLHFQSYVTMKYFTFVVTWIPCFILFAISSSHEGDVLATKSSFNKGLERYLGTFLLTYLN